MAETKLERIKRFKAFPWWGDACVCNEGDGWAHTHYQDGEPHRCARCGDKCSGYCPAFTLDLEIAGLADAIKAHGRS